MVSYDDLPDDPLDRSTEIDRRIEAEITKLLARRRVMKKVYAVVGVVAVIGFAIWITLRLTAPPEITSEDYIADAANLRDQGKFAQARDTLDKALKLDPKQLGARRLRGELAIAMGDGPDAREHFRVASPDGRGPVVQLGLLRAHLLEGEFTKASKTAAEALERTRNEEIDLVLAQALVGEGKVDAAREQLDNLLTRYQNHQEALSTRARLHLRDGDLAGAKTVLDKIAEREETSRELILRADFALRSGAPDTAKRLFTGAQRLNPNHPETFVGLARHALAGGDNAAAVAAIASIPNEPRSRDLIEYFKAFAKWRAGDTTGAAKASLALLERGSFLDAELLLADTELSAGNHAQAIGRLKKLSPERDFAVAARLADALLKTGAPDEAKTVLTNIAKHLRPAPAELSGAIAALSSESEEAPKALPFELPPLFPLARCDTVIYACEHCIYVRTCD